MQVTLSVLKADVGSIGGHTRPSEAMIEVARKIVAEAVRDGTIIDGLVTFTGDDICLILSHTHGENAADVHIGIGLKTFRAATALAQEAGLYGAGQDILVDAPSGNIRGAGPAVAELTFGHDLTKEGGRPSESFMVFAADKCGPGVYNFPLGLAFSDPMYCGGLLLSPKMSRGFSFDIIDMNETRRDSLIALQAPEDLYRIAALLRDEHRFAIDGIYSRAFPEQRAVAVSAQRLHNIAGTYTGKDDPVAIVRNQGMFPAPEELMQPWTLGHFTGGDARGSHNMPILPVPIRTAVTGPYCLPLVSCLGFSMAAGGTFTRDSVDFFDNPVWDAVRHRITEKGVDMRRQGYFGPAMLPMSELEYGGIKTILAELMPRFVAREKLAGS